ncbi:MAG: hypothetical protein AAF289_21680 [Cyanobacteria bacterium P01_A01_bin.135]
MSASPFETIEEFNGVVDGPTEGAIYTFAHTPALNAIALVVSVGLFIWFLVGTYSTHHNVPSKMDKSLNSLVMLITVGLLSLVSGEFRQPSQTTTTAEAQSQGLSSSSRQVAPFAFLGMTAMGAARRFKPRQRRRSGPRRR